MKTFRYIIPFAAALMLLVGCSGKKDTPSPGPDPDPQPGTDPVNPELTVTGVPTDAVESGTSFTLKLSSKSEGSLSVSVDKPAFAGLQSLGNMEYKVQVMSIEDNQVTVSVTQEATTEYLAASAKATIKIKGLGSGSIPGPDDAVEGTAVTYTESAKSPVNPERGLYTTHEVHSDKVSPVSVGTAKGWKGSGHSVVLLEYYLTDFMYGSISAKYIKNIQADFDAFREAGIKAIVRFAYKDHNASDEDMDPEVDQVLKHVAQLKSVLQKNEDVIFVLQAGFVGAWGEWYYTTHFGFSPKTAADYAPRKQLTEALLDALPVSRQIQLRTPAFKMKMYGLSVNDALTEATAHDGSAKSRLAGHNDCFGASKNDQGTFDDDDTRAFWKADTRYTIMGGETCALSDYCLCPQTLQDLKDYHWTYLHDGYNQEVLSRWRTDGCYNEIERDLGYRLVLQDVHYDAIEAGKPCKVTIRMENKGYAAPMNPREAWLVWKGSDGKVVKSLLGSDPRTWHSGYNGIVTSFTPSTDQGTLYLELSDPLLSTRPEYSIALANDNVFEGKTGYNKLFEVN